MEYPHQQYVQYRQQQQPHQPSQQRLPPTYARPYAGSDPHDIQIQQAGAADNERPMPPEAAIESLQRLAQCSRDEARYYLEEHNYDVHRAMAARTADVRWEHQHGSAPSSQQQPQALPAETVVQDAALQAQLQEARQRLRSRYERETGDRSSSPGALELPLAQHSLPTLVPVAAAPAPLPATQTAPPSPLVYFPSPTAAATAQYEAPHYAAQQPQPYAAPPPYYGSAQQQQQVAPPYPPSASTAYVPLQHYAGQPMAAQAPQPVAAQQDWEEVRREEANISAGRSTKENYLTLAGQTLGKWIWGGSHHKDKSSASTSTSTAPSTQAAAPPPPLSSSVSSPSFYPTTSTVTVGEERHSSMGRRHQSDDSLEINELARDRRNQRSDGTARDEEAIEEREGESRGGLRHLFHSVRHRGREIVDRIDHRHASTTTTTTASSSSTSLPQQLPPAAEEEELESRRGHRRRSSVSSGMSKKKEKRASLDEGWVLVNNSSSSAVPLTDEQYAARLSRQLAEEEERQRRRDEELARRIQRQEEEEVRRRAREAQAEEAQRDSSRAGGRRHRSSHGPIHVVVSRSRGPFGEMIVSEGGSPSTIFFDEPRGRRRRTAGGLVGLLEIMREMHEMSLAQNMSHESGYPFVLAPDASSSASAPRRQDMTYEQLLGLAERMGNVNRGVSHAAMEALPTRTYQDKEKKADQEDNKCTICLCEYEEGDTLRTLPCLHSYHKDCIDHWLKSHNTCPVCKTQINM